MDNEKAHLLYVIYIDTCYIMLYEFRKGKTVGGATKDRLVAGDEKWILYNNVQAHEGAELVCINEDCIRWGYGCAFGRISEVWSILSSCQQAKRLLQ